MFLQKDNQVGVMPEDHIFFLADMIGLLQRTSIGYMGHFYYLIAQKGR